MNFKTLLIASIALVATMAIGTRVSAQAKLSETQKIEALIQSVQQLKGAQFYRNGSYYDAVKAADHLRMKWGKAGSRVKTAQDFIEVVGTKSYLSGEEYHIKLSAGRKVATKAFFTQRLKEIMASKK
jgi:hypothetical protein